MTVNNVLSILNHFAPLSYTEDFDNTGLLVGDGNATVTGILVTLDTLETVVDEAIAKKCNLIVSFHPIVFKGLKKITGKTYVERTVLKAIKNDIHIIAIHTALDNSYNGVNAMICKKLGLINREILIPKSQTIKKLVTYVPNNDLEQVRTALFMAGAGNIGNYSSCSFTTKGTGTFKGDENANPVIGTKGILQQEPEIQLHITFASYLESKIIATLKQTHPYEEVAYEITTLNNKNQHIGMGMVGELPQEMAEDSFLSLLKNTFNTGCVKHSQKTGKTIRKIAVLGGSGSFAINDAIVNNADAYVTADLKYHDFFMAENRILLADVGHYESEQYTKELLHAHLTEKISNFAPALPLGKVLISETNTNPISYF